MTCLKLIREEAGLTQQDVAQILKIKRATYSSYEIERDVMPIKHLNEICNYFNVSFDYVFGLSKNKNYINERMDVDPKLMCERIKKLRKEKKLTQLDIANYFNIARSTWTGYEYGNYRFPTYIIYTLAKKYHVSMDYLIGKID